MRGFHPESQCMKKQIDKLSTLLEQNNISLLQGVNKSNDGHPTEDHERCHALKESLTESKAYLIDSRASNHMVASSESFIIFPLSGGPSRHMGDESKIPDVEIGLEKIQHDEFMPSPTENKIVEDEEEAKFSIHSH